MIEDNNRINTEGQEWLKGIVQNIIKSTSLIMINEHNLIDASKIAAIELKGCFSSDFPEGSVKLRLQLDGGGVVETEGLSRNQVEQFKQNLDIYNKIKNSQKKGLPR